MLKILIAASFLVAAPVTFADPTPANTNEGATTQAEKNSVGSSEGTSDKLPLKLGDTISGSDPTATKVVETTSEE